MTLKIIVYRTTFAQGDTIKPISSTHICKSVMAEQMKLVACMTGVLIWVFFISLMENRTHL